MRIAAMQAHGEMIRVVVLCATDSPELLEAVEFEPGQSSVVKDMLKRHKVEHVVGVVPAAQSVCRCVELPVHSGDISETIALLVETQLSSESPAHRRAGGSVLGSTRGKSVALLTAWHESSSPPFDIHDGVEPDCWVTQVAAMQALRLGNAGLIGYADRSVGTIALFASGDRGTVARILLESNREEFEWDEAVEKAIRETSEAAGGEPEQVIRRTDGQCLLISRSDSSSLSTTLRGVSRDSDWFETYGIALGAALVASSTNADTRSLAAMRFSSADSNESGFAKAGQWISTPRNAWLGGLVAAMLMLLTPLAVAWGRAAILESKVDAAREHESRSLEVSKKNAVYKEVAKSYLPMTKILADLSQATPIGIEIDSINVDPRSSEIQIEGRAESNARVNEYLSILNKSGIFERAASDRTESRDDGQIEFSVATHIWNPHAQFEGGTDFAEESVAKRMYGVERASNLNWKPGPGGSTRSSSPRATNDRPDRNESRGSSGSTPVRSSFGAKPAAKPIPDPLTAEELAGTNRVALMRAKISRNSALKATEDEDIKARLTDEIRQINERLDALKAGGAL